MSDSHVHIFNADCDVVDESSFTSEEESKTKSEKKIHWYSFYTIIKHDNEHINEIDFGVKSIEKAAEFLSRLCKYAKTGKESFIND